MFDYVRISLAVPHTTVGAVEKNKADILEKIRQADKAGADYIVFPELALTGYTCADLFFQDSLLDNVKTAMGEIAAATEPIDATVLVGAPFEINGQLYNCAAVVSGGRICGLVPKTFLPNYNEFYEKRWFTSARDGICDTVDALALGQSTSYPVPVSNRLVFTGRRGETFGAEICEDAWTPLSPGTHLALAGAELLFNLSASNETIGKREYRRNLVRNASASALCAYAYVSAGSGESTTDLIFSGHSLVCENGTLLCENDNFIDDDYILNSDVDLGKIRADRRKLKSFADSAAADGVCRDVQRVKVYAPLTHRAAREDEGVLYPLRKLPFVPTDKDTRTERCLNIFEMQVAGLAKRLSAAAQKVVVGVSGGLDSTLALLVCVQAMKKLRRPVTNVVGITMPCFGTTSRTYNNSLALMRALGVTAREINIKDACLQHFKDIGHDEAVKDITFENVQARERTQVLMDVANAENALVCGTGDLSELALGWCTYNADHMSMYGVNASIPKTLIRWMIESLAAGEVFPGCADILMDVADTPISPELLPPDENGKIAQKTEDTVGPYALHDFFLYYVLRYGFTPEKIYFLACRAFAGDFDGETVKKWLKTFYRRFFTQQF
ncbi:MAG: NAD(+) synthase, partial [Eubacteriales bacterium]